LKIEISIETKVESWKFNWN